MKKSHKITYWIATVWLALGMVSTAVVQLLKMQEEADNITHLGYPLYLLNILGVWKLLGVVAVLAPGLPRIKEWAYAGFFFSMSGAVLSHIAVGNPAEKIFPSLLLLVLTIVSWLFRPSDRKLT
ncbi:MAG TPA: DoxX family protein [Saprospiraceae bacterium]|nr:DoxX family protein [Saprospiraceae bacterium]